jgi:acyl-CoA dehydrogenase-like protein
MRTKIEAGRTLLYETSIVVDIRDGLEHMIEKYPDKKSELRADLRKYTAMASLMTPMVKAYNTEMANEVAYDGVQIHGGTGFMREFNAERHTRDARITNIYEGTTQLQVVAAIGGVIKGVAMDKIGEYESSIDFSGNEPSHKIVKEMVSLVDESINYVKEHDNDYQDYHARRLVEMVTSVFIGYLMLRDASRSDRKKDVLKYFLEFALPAAQMRHDIIMANTNSFLDKKDAILDGKN